MVKQTTKYFGIAAALALCLSLTGCESWRRAAPDSPKELPVYSEQMTEPSTEPSTEASDEQPVERENAQALTVGQNSQTKESGWVTAVSITRTSDSAQAFVSADEMLSQKAGLDPQKMLSAIGAGAAGSWQLTNMAPRALAGDFAPGFFIKHFIKDMKIVQEESRKSGVELEMLDTVLALYEKMAQQGLENDGTQALIKYYQK